MSGENSLIIMERAAQMLAEAKTIQEVKEFRDLALTAADWAKRRRLGKEAVQHAQKYALLAERKLGEMLKEEGRKKGQYERKGKCYIGEHLPPTLSSLGLTRRESAEAQLLAAVPEKEFTALIEGRKSRKAIINEQRRKMKREEFSKHPELPEKKKYRVIYADPPWPYDQWLPHQYGDVEKHYPTMSIESLCALPVKNMAEKDAVLFLWVPSPKLERAFEVIRAWGFEYKTSFVWDKVKHNFGYYNSVRHEFLLVAGRGQSTPDTKELVDSVISIERSKKHSEKPDYFRDLIDKLYTSGNRIELFYRGKKKKAGWDTWGDED